MLENELTPSTNPTTVYLKDYQKPNFIAPTISLDITLTDHVTTVITTTQYRREHGNDDALILDGEKFRLVSISLDGRELAPDSYLEGDGRLTISNVPDEFELVIITEVKPDQNTELSGLYRSSGNFCTQCEAEGFRRITYFQDRPDVLSVYDVKITGDKTTCPVLLSNGNPTSAGENENGTHWAHWHDPHPKPCYLFALVAGDLQAISDSFTTVTGKSIVLNIYAQSHNIEKCAHAMVSLQNSMRWDEEVYGREYDLDLYNIVAVDDFNMGAMENKGLNIFNSKYVLANQQTATDTDYQGIESVIAHEYFHNWSGNRVTCRDWFQLSLKEGFTVFRDQEFSADMGSRAVKRIRDVKVLRAYQFKQDAGPMAHPVRPDSYQEINNFYTVTIYNKGAEVIRMMRHLVGSAGFRNGTDRYFDEFDGQAVTTEDFVTSIEKANQVNLQQFRLWYTQSGTPVIQVHDSFDTGVLTLVVRQHCLETPGQPDKEPFQIPISLALFGSGGKKLHEQTLVLTDAEQTFTFIDLEERPAISLFRDFSAPVKLQYEQSNDDLSTLIKHEDNGFSRWEALQRLSLRVILPAITSGTFDETAYQILLVSFQKVIESQLADKAVLAEMLVLPSSTYIAELCAPIDPQRIVQVREQCVERLAKDLESEFHTIYANNNTRSNFSLEPEAMAERALKNVALVYLVATDQAAYYALASHQYHSATNMTDCLAAFSALVHSDYAERKVLVEQFYQRWKTDTLVMDKWFAMQALAPRENVLNNVVELTEHAAFSINNPNKVRALVGAFTGNLLGFHRKDGSGYQFLADKVIQLNQINPQIAAGLVSVFNNWRAYSEPYNTNMKEQLERIQKSPSLANDVAEIVGKALAK